MNLRRRPMMFDLSGKVAVVTGGSRGIGRSICEQMAAHGAKVVVSSRKLPACEEVVKGIKAKGGEAVAFAASISDKAQLEALIAFARKTYGKIDIMAYNMSKAADINLVKSLAMEWGKHNIRVNCIAPGLIQTDFAKALWDNPEIRKANESKAALKRIGQPDDIGGVAVFLASTAGNFVCGQTIIADGGVIGTGAE